MPRYRKKRTYKKKKYARKRKATMGKSVGFPKERTVKLRYVEYLSLVSTTGVITQHRFRANSVQDPNASGIGHQPYCYDQWSVFYNHYQVQSSKINCKLVTNTANGSIADSIAGIYLADDSTTSFDWVTFCETGRGPTTILPASPSDKVRSLSSSFNLKKFYNGRADPGNTSALVSANPTEEAFYSIWLQSMDQTATTQITYWKVTIDYVVRFFEPKDLPGS